MDEVTFASHPSVGAAARIRGLNFQSHPVPNVWGQEWDRRSPVANGLVNHDYVMKPS